MECINKAVTISGVKVHLGDLIFADSDGIVVIPQKYEKLVINKALETIDKEKNIITKIVLGKTADNIIETVGVF